MNSKDNDGSFPFKNKFLTEDEIRNRFKALKAFEPVFMQEKYMIYNIPSLQWYDKLYYPEMQPKILAHSPENYHALDEISDYFIEDVRIKARRFDTDLSMEQYWYKNEASIKEKFHEDLYEQREYLSAVFKEVGTFRPTNIVAIIKMFKAKNIFDFSSGWGDRLIGALACEVESYTATDPNKDLTKGYKAINDFFNKDNKTIVTMNCCKIEDYKTEETNKVDIDIEDTKKEKSKIDLIFTSPPYFDLEIYNEDDDQSHKYGNQWYEKFLLVALKKVWSLLSEDGHMVIIINDKPVDKSNNKINSNKTNGKLSHSSFKDDSYVQRMIRDVNLFSDSLYLGILPYAEYKGNFAKPVDSKMFRSPQPMFIWQKKPLSFKLIEDSLTLMDPIPDIRARAYKAFANERHKVFWANKDPLFLACVAKLNGKEAYFSGNVDKSVLKALMYGLKIEGNNKTSNTNDTISTFWSPTLKALVVKNLKETNEPIKQLNSNSFVLAFFKDAFGTSYNEKALVYKNV